MKHNKKNFPTYSSKDLYFTSQDTPQPLHCLHGGAWTEYPVLSKLYISIESSTGNTAVGEVSGDCCVAVIGRGGAEGDILNKEEVMNVTHLCN